MFSIPLLYLHAFNPSVHVVCCFLIGYTSLRALLHLQYVFPMLHLIEVLNMYG